MAFINNTYQVSGNVYIQSGVAWTGTGSVTGALTGSFAITNTPNVQPLIGSIYGIGAGSVYAQVLGSVQVVNTVTTQPLIGSIYGIGIGSLYAQVLGSVQVVNTVTTQPLIGSIYGIGIGSIYANVGNTVTTQPLIGSIYGIGVGSVYATVGNTVTTQPLIGSMYGIGIGSMYVQVGAPATIGSLATQGMIGSVQITNTSISTQGFVGNAQSVTGSPFLGAALAKSANPSALSDGQVGYNIADLKGRQVFVLNHVRDMTTQPGSDAVLTASGTAILLVQSGGTAVFNDVTLLDITNGGSVATRVDLLSSGTIYRSFQIPANGGLVRSFPTPMKQPQANAAWTATLDTAVNRDVRVWIQTIQNT